MSKFGNFLVGAVEGAATSAANLAGKYIDEELLQRRAQTLADINRASALQQRKDIDTYDNDPTRRESLRAEAGKDAAAVQQVALDGKIAEETSTSLREAKLRNAREAAAIPGQVAAEQTIANSKNKDYLAGVKAISLADPRVQAQLDQARAAIASSGAQARLTNMHVESAKLDLEDKKKLNALFDNYEQVLNDKSLDDKTRAVELGKITTRLEVIRAKNGRSAGSNESDTVKITEEEQTPTGTRKIERTEKRKPGGAAAASETPAAAPSGQPWAKFGAPKSESPAPSSTAAPARTSAAPASTKPRQVDPIWAGIESDLAPLLEQYQTAKAQHGGAARSGDPQSIAYYQGPLMEARRRLMEAANGRLGNQAQDYLARVGVN